MSKKKAGNVLIIIGIIGAILFFILGLIIGIDLTNEDRIVQDLFALLSFAATLFSIFVLVPLGIALRSSNLFAAICIGCGVPSLLISNVIFLGWLGIFFSTIAIVFGIKSLKKISRGQAQSGRVISIIGIFSGLIGFIMGIYSFINGALL